MILIRHGQSHFNLHFAATRVDPGIVDPDLTEDGKRQAEAAASDLTRHENLQRIVASPSRRTLHTAEIIAARLGLPVVIDALVRERAYFTCDIGSHRSRLAARWPDFHYGDLPERWWPEPNETETELHGRCRQFRDAMARRDDWQEVLVVSHWGFIRGLTGREIDNCDMVSFDPTAGSAAP